MGIDLKKEIKLSDLFKRKGPTEPRAAKVPKAPRAKAPKAPQRDHQPSHDVPLMRAFNLLPKEDPREAGSPRPHAAKIVLAFVGVVLVAGLGAAYTVMSATVDDKRSARDALQAEVEALREQAAESGEEQVDPALVSEKNLRTYALASALSGRVAWDRLLREVSLVTPEDVWLSGLAATPSESSTTAGQSALTVNGYTHGQEGVARMLARLAVVPELSSVQLVSSASSLIGDTEVVQFSIAALVKLPGGESA